MTVLDTILNALVKDQNRVARTSVYLFAPFPILVTLFSGVAVLPIVLGSLSAVLVAVISRRLPLARSAALIAFALIQLCVVFSASFAGHPLQIDSHMVFFAGLAIIATMANPAALILAVVLTAIHHLSFGLLLPSFIYPSSDVASNMQRTVLHASVVVFEAAILFLSMQAMAQVRAQVEGGRADLEKALREADVARTRAEAAREHAQKAAEQTREQGRQAGVAVEQITASAALAAVSSAESRQAATRAKADAERSTHVTRRAREAMATISKASQDIEGIVEIIDEIARRTDLLALNAAVESARAGEAGRGFAVVANEVRKLAQQSADATQRIRKLVSTSSSQVRDGTAQVTEANEALDRILAAIVEVEGRMATIATSAAEQSTALQQVSVAINRIDSIASEDRGADKPLRLVA